MFMCNSLIEAKIPSVAAYGSCPQRCLTGAFHRLHELSHLFLGGTFGQVLILIDPWCLDALGEAGSAPAARLAHTGRKPVAPARPQKRTCDSIRPRLSSQETRPRLRRSTAPTIDAAPQPSSGTSTSSSSVIGRTAETALVFRSYRGRSRRVDQRTACAAHSTVSGDRGSKATSSLHR